MTRLYQGPAQASTGWLLRQSCRSECSGVQPLESHDMIEAARLGMAKATVAIWICFWHHPSPMATFAIGDIHVCHTALTTLLNEVNPTAADRLIFLGDYIDRGPASRSVMDFLISQAGMRSCVFLRGNHEVMVLEARDDPMKANL